MSQQIRPEGAGTDAPGPADRSDLAPHDLPLPDQLRAAIAADWQPAPAMPHPARPDLAEWAARRRDALSGKFPDRLVVVPAGRPQVRANDTDYPFRASSAFTWLTGETVADAVLVMTPRTGGHDAVLYLREYAPPGQEAYFTSRTHGALWVGNVPTSAETQSILRLTTRGLNDLAGDLRSWRDSDAAVLTGLDPDVDTLLPRGSGAELAQVVDELRLAKDEWEIARLRHACAATARGFADVVREIPTVLGRSDLRGERWLEGTFGRRARLEGNDVGYHSIVAAGRHGTVLHWWRNHGAIEAGQLLLADMGVESDELYTADVTRTMPVSGQWSADQLRVYRAVLEAQSAGIAEVKAGADFVAAHRAAMWVLADHLYSWGVLSVPPEVSCSAEPEQPGAGLYRRYTLHSTSHMLGIDVHDCAAAREQVTRNGALHAGYVLTVEPGLYFQPNDATVPAELRGLAVRIEDDILVTDGAPVNLSDALPRDPNQLVAWMRETQNSPTSM
jgi:Xaa-Pro aminopeptidase